jgi:hypothetical protein
LNSSEVSLSETRVIICTTNVEASKQFGDIDMLLHHGR